MYFHRFSCQCIFIDFLLLKSDRFSATNVKCFSMKTAPVSSVMGKPIARRTMSDFLGQNVINVAALSAKMTTSCAQKIEYFILSASGVLLANDS